MLSAQQEANARVYLVGSCEAHRKRKQLNGIETAMRFVHHHVTPTSSIVTATLSIVPATWSIVTANLSIAAAPFLNPRGTPDRPAHAEDRVRR